MSAWHDALAHRRPHPNPTLIPYSTPKTLKPSAAANNLSSDNLRLQVADAQETARAAEEMQAANEREAAALEARRSALAQREAAAAAEGERLAAAAADATASAKELSARGARVSDAEARVQARTHRAVWKTCPCPP